MAERDNEVDQGVNHSADALERRHVGDDVLRASLGKERVNAEIARLIRDLRRQVGLTQAELAERIGTTQSSISRLEDADYEGHSLSMLYRIARAMDRRVTVIMSSGHRRPASLEVREPTAGYRGNSVAADAARDIDSQAGELAEDELAEIAQRLAERFKSKGLTRSDVEEAIRAVRRRPKARHAFLERRGSIEVGAGSVVDDVRRARERRGASSSKGKKR